MFAYLYNLSCNSSIFTLATKFTGSTLRPFTFLHFITYRFVALGSTYRFFHPIPIYSFPLCMHHIIYRYKKYYSI